MKLATLKSTSRDGCLVVVSRDLTQCARVPHIAASMQYALDNWEQCAPQLRAVYQALNAGELSNAELFDPSACAAPLPRAYQWADGSAYVNHVELVRKARGAQMPESFWTDPLMYQGGSDSFLGPQDPVPFGSTDWGIDFEAEIAIVTDDVPMGTSVEEAGEHIQLLMLCNDWSLRNLIPGELGKGFGFFQSKPSSSFSPVAITPDELGDAWSNWTVHLPLVSTLNGEPFGCPNAGVDMTFNFAQLVSHAAKTRPLGAGCVIGSGTISNIDRSKGSSCLAERRMLEKIEYGEPKTPFLGFGDRVRIEMLDTAGASLFGALDAEVIAYETATV